MFAAADWIEVLAALIFFLITGIAQVLQNRSRRKRGLPPITEGEPVGTPQPRPTPSEPQPVVMEDWERQLRRLLQGEPASTPPPVLPTAAPPPLTRPVRPAPVRDESFSWESEEHEHRSLADFPGSEATANTGERIEAQTQARLSRASSFAAASRALGHASDLHGSVAERMRAARERTDPKCAPDAAGTAPSGPSVTPGTSQAPVRSGEIASVVAMLKRPATARQAILAALVLQPPRALEDSVR